MQSEPEQHFFDASSARLAYVTWGAADADPLLLIHATGFHGRVWDRTVAHLAGPYRVIAPDMRGHGLSSRPGPVMSWREPAGDLAELADALGLDGAVGVGHSMGGHCLVQLAAGKPERFRHLVLFDPVILDPADYETGLRHLDGIESPSAHPVARRRNDWAKWEEMAARFRSRHPYSLWRPEVLEDYCRHGVRPKPEGGGFELACPPEIEASVYMSHASVDIYDEVAAVTAPVTVVRARERGPDDADRMDFAISPTWPGLAGCFANGRDIHRPDLTHFIPMQDPAFTARVIDEAARDAAAA